MTKESPDQKTADLLIIRRALKYCGSSVKFTLDAFLAEHYAGMYVPITEVDSYEHLGTCHCLKAGVTDDAVRAYAGDQYVVSFAKVVKDRRKNTVQTTGCGGQPSLSPADQAEESIPQPEGVPCCSRPETSPV